MRKPFTILFGIVIFISGCINQGKQAPPNPPISSKPSATAVNTQMPIQPTWTPTLGKPTITSTPKLNHLDIPKWVSDPNVDVLLLPIGDYRQFNNFALVNSTTGEVYNLPDLPHGYYFWLSDGHHFGILTEGGNEIVLVNILTGKVTFHQPSRRAVQFVGVDDESTYSLISIGRKVEDPDFMLIYSWWDVSPDNHYLILDEKYDERYTLLFDLHTDETITLTDIDDNIFDIRRGWNPTGPYLGIVHSDAETGFMFSFEKDPNFRLKVYDVEHGKVIGSYKNIPFVIWSPDGTKLLYQPWEASPDIHDFLHHENPPCVFDILTGVTKCYNEAVVRHSTPTTYELTFSSAQWSPDGKKIGYIYFRIEHNSQEPYYEEQGGICLITLENNSTECLLDELEGVIQNKNPIDFWWSPNGDYLVFVIADSSPYSDDQANPEFGVININSGESFFIEEKLSLTSTPFVWRPKISP
jgi:hypothetical protein